MTLRARLDRVTWRLRAYAGIALIAGGVILSEALDALNWPGQRRK